MPRRRDPELSWLDGGREEVFALPEGETRVGRAPENDLRIDDKTVSRYHCLLVRERDEVRIIDSRSHNSTAVNEEPVRDRALQSGDVLRLGRRFLRFDDGLSEAPASPGARTTSTAQRRTSLRRRAAAPSAVPWLPLTAGLAGVFALGFAAFVVGSKGLDEQTGLRMATTKSGDVQDRLSAAKIRLRGRNERLDALEDEVRIGSDAGRRGTVEQGQAVLVLRQQIHDLEIEIRALRAEAERNEEITWPELLEGDDHEILPQPVDEKPAAGVATLPDVDATEAERDAAARVGGSTYLSDRRIGSGASQSRPSRSTTVVVQEQRRRTSALDVRALVAALTATLDDYATPSTTVESLEPALGELVDARTRAAAAGLLKVFRHGRELEKDGEETLRFLRERVKKLLAQAERQGGSRGEGSGKREGSHRSVPPEVEQLQRLLELSEKKVSIKETQLARLQSLLQRIHMSFAQLVHREAVLLLTSRFGSERDPPIQRAILLAVGSAGAESAIPALLRRFSSRDEALRRSVRQTLISIVGEDLGGEKRAWAEWWTKRQKELGGAVKSD